MFTGSAYTQGSYKWGRAKTRVHCLELKTMKGKGKAPQRLLPPVDTDVRTSLYNSVTLLGSSEVGYRPCAGSSDVGALLTMAHTYRWGCCLSSTTPVRYCLSPQRAWLEAEFPVCLQMHSRISGCRDKMQQSPLIAQKTQKLHKQAKVGAGFRKRNKKSWLPGIQFSRHMENPCSNEVPNHPKRKEKQGR